MCVCVCVLNELIIHKLLNKERDEKEVDTVCTRDAKNEQKLFHVKLDHAYIHE